MRLKQILYLTLLALVLSLALWLTAQPASTAQTALLPCADGFAGVYPCQNVDGLGWLSVAQLGGGPNIETANLWGWTDPLTEREYALVGLSDGTAFVDVTDPTAPRWLGTLPTHNTISRYRDVKTYQHYALIVADVPLDSTAPGEGTAALPANWDGVQIFDLHQLRTVITAPVTFTATAHFDGFDAGHNIFVNEDTGFAYISRTTIPDLCNGGLYMLNLADPLDPSFAGCVSDGGLASDSMCVTYAGPDTAYHGHEICLIASDDDILITDVTTKTAPNTLSTFSYRNATRAHNAWFTPNQRYFVSSDMNDEMQHGENTRLFVWDVQTLTAPRLLDVYSGPTPASDHNVWVRGDYAYIGNFQAGLRIVDLSQIATTSLTQSTLSEAAYFDLVPAQDTPMHMGGAWAAYVYFESGVVAVTDKQAGLYLLRPNLPGPTRIYLPLLLKP